MGLLRQLFRNVSYLTVGSQLGNLLQFVFFLVFARRFGTDVLGKYSFAFSFTYIGYVLADLGLSTYMMREVSRDRSGDRRLLARCLVLRVIALGALTLAGGAVVLLFFKDFPAETLQIILDLGLYHIFLSLADIFLAEFKGHDQMGTVSLLNVFVRLIISGAGILMMGLHLGFLTVLAAFPAGGLLYLLSTISASRRRFGRAGQWFEGLRTGGLLAKVLPFAVALVSAEALYHADVLMLRLLRDDQSVGVFAAANNIVLAFIGVLLFVHTGLLPTFSRLYLESKDQLRDVAGRIARYLVILGLPVATGLFALSGRLIPFLFSGAYGESVVVLKILSWSVGFAFTAAAFSILLTAVNRQTEKMIALGACLVVNVGLNGVLIPRLGAPGAAAVKVATEALHLALMAFLATRFFSSLSLGKIVVRPALSSALMYAFIRVFPGWPVLLLVAASAAVYVISLVIVGGLSGGEIETLKGFLLRRRGRAKLIKEYGPPDS